MQLTKEIAANYLRVDDPDQATLVEIQAMLEGAIHLMDRSTGYIYQKVTKSYPCQPDGNFRIYDFPINTDLTALDPAPDFVVKDTYTLIGNPNAAEQLELSVGYEDPSEYPNDLAQWVLQIVKHWYYESETKTAELLPAAVRAGIRHKRRFIL